LPRASGILLHPTSLPGPYGIGDLGSAADAFLDFLVETGQRWWQILPLGPTGFGNSPYQSHSSYAGNPLLISPDRLVAEGLLAQSELRDYPALSDAHVDFDGVALAKEGLLRRAFERFGAGDAGFVAFQRENVHWLDDYALYMALKEAHDARSWNDWEPEIAARKPAAMADWREKLPTRVRYHQFVQYLFDRQWRRFREHCRARGVGLIGDLPIFVSQDSSDVWARPDLFLLDELGRPTFVAGVPPDYFSETGQLWGNPLYRWEAHAAEHFAWWVSRMKATTDRVDFVRLDHFRGFEAFWEVPADAPTAASGRWALGPGSAFLDALKSALGGLPLIAEDLGNITVEVEALRDRFDLPGMKILQFAFGNDAAAEKYLPYSYPNHCIVYTGTHDNDTTAGWFTTTDSQSTQSSEEIAEERAFVRRFLGYVGDEIHWELIRLALSSVADTAIFPLQDILGLGGEARMNVPGQATGNWQWRFESERITPEIRHRLADLTAVYGRWNGEVLAAYRTPRRPVVKEPFVGR
jgi:4-alpha-glucanotransferase